MQKIYDIKINKISYGKDKFNTSKLEIEISGSDNHAYVMNAIRRILYDDIPVHAVHSGSSIIEKNTTIFNNDYMKLRLSLLPLYNIKNNFINIEEQFLDINTNNPKYHKDEDIYKLCINEQNNTNDEMIITTHNMRIYKNNNNIDNFYINLLPIPLIILKPKNIFTCTLQSKISIGEKNSIWSSANAYYKIINENEKKYILTVETRGQFKENELLVRACEVIINKLYAMEKNFSLCWCKTPTQGNCVPCYNKEKNAKNEKNDDGFYNIEFINEDYTLGNLLGLELYKNKNVIFSGIYKQADLVHSINIKIKIIDGDIKNIISSAIDGIVNKFTYIKNIFNKITL